MSRFIKSFVRLASVLGMAAGLSLSFTAPSTAQFQDLCDDWFWCPVAQIFPDGRWCSPYPPSFCQNRSVQKLDTGALNSLLNEVDVDESFVTYEIQTVSEV